MVRGLHSALNVSERFWLAVTSLGSDLVFIFVLALYAWLVKPAGMRQLGVVFSLSYLTNTLLKYGLNLPRPFVAGASLASEAATATAGGPGLPSGHAQMSATLWLGMAWQLAAVAWQLAAAGRARPALWALAVSVVSLVSLSRLVLGVHDPSDVLTGLLIGVFFAWLTTLRLPLLAWNFWVPLLALIAAAFLSASAPREYCEYSAGLGLLAGFWLLRREFAAPTTWPARVGVTLVGLLLVFAVYFGLTALLPAGIRDSGLGRALRYALLVLMAGEGVPGLLKVWLPERNPSA